AGCGGAKEITAPPPPLRPEPEPLPEQRGDREKDCENADPKLEGPSMSFDERSIPESNKLAEGAKSKLRTAESAEVERSTREEYITEAVADLITSLRADPYNVTATYYLAKAYARIGRPQCSMNLLTRLLQLRTHPSKRPDVEVHLDMLLGRKQVLDPDFSEMRRDDRFRELIKRMCDGTNDPNCVYGAQRDNRER
ncbi:MAG: hypothetical protein ACTHU0_39365, partial [Kofleriaceae bacterium]